jgi:hypothetical protein
MSLYYKGLPAHMRAYANDRELEGFLGRLQALKNKVVMQSEIDNEDVGERLAQLEELKKAALERRAANKKPKVGQEGMSEADKQIIKDAEAREREKMNRAASKIQRNFKDSKYHQIKNLLGEMVSAIEEHPPANDQITTYKKPLTPAERGRLGGIASGKARSAKSKKKATQSQ